MLRITVAGRGECCHLVRAASRHLITLVFVSLFALWPSGSHGDWLVTSEGEVIETRGPWHEKGASIVFTGANGVLSSLRSSAIDLEASRQLTRRGGPLENVEKTERSVKVERAQPVLVLKDGDVARYGGSSPTAAPQIVMYTTDWCPVCKRAKALLVELEADFVEKDVERDLVAAMEHRAKSQGRGGVPLLDYGGSFLRGFSESWIRRAVAHQRETRQAEQR